jgi:hypothetical protein
MKISNIMNSFDSVIQSVEKHLHQIRGFNNFNSHLIEWLANYLHGHGVQGNIPTSYACCRTKISCILT